MFSAVMGVLCLSVTVWFVKNLQKRKARPYFLAYAVVILTGLYGVRGFLQHFNPMMEVSPVEASLNGLTYVAAFIIMFWGFSVFKRLQIEAE